MELTLSERVKVEQITHMQLLSSKSVSILCHSSCVCCILLSSTCICVLLLVAGLGLMVSVNRDFIHKHIKGLHCAWLHMAS